MAVLWGGRGWGIMGRKVSFGFEHSELSEGAHACLIYTKEEDRRSIIARFLESGIAAHERVLSLVDTLTLPAYVQAMSELGVELGGRDDVELREALPFYNPDGQFSGQRMLDLIKEFHEVSRAEGYEGSRGTGEMTWALAGTGTNREDLMSYEARINELVVEHPMTVCCQYDARRFDGATIMEVLSVHPMMIVNGVLIENPLYVPPSAYFESQPH